MHRLTSSYINVSSPQVTRDLHSSLTSSFSDVPERSPTISTSTLPNIEQIGSKLSDFGRNSLRGRKKAPLIIPPKTPEMPTQLETRVKELHEELEAERLNNEQSKEQLRSLKRNQQMLERKIKEYKRLAQQNDSSGSDQTIQDLKNQIGLGESLLKQERSACRELVSEVSKALCKKAQVDNDLKAAKKQLALKGFKINKKKGNSPKPGELQESSSRIELVAASPVFGEEKLINKQISASHEKIKAAEVELQNELEDFVCKYALTLAHHETVVRDKELLQDQSTLLHLDLFIDLENNTALDTENKLLENQFLFLRHFLVSSSDQQQQPVPPKPITPHPQLAHSVPTVPLVPVLGFGSMGTGSSALNPLVSPRKPPRPSGSSIRSVRDPVTVDPRLAEALLSPRGLSHRREEISTSSTPPHKESLVRSAIQSHSMPHQTPSMAPLSFDKLSLSSATVPTSDAATHSSVKTKEKHKRGNHEKNHHNNNNNNNYSGSVDGSHLGKARLIPLNLPPLHLPTSSHTTNTQSPTLISTNQPSPSMSAASFSVMASPGSSRLELSNDSGLTLGLLSPLPPLPPDSTVSSPLSLLPVSTELPLLAERDDSDDSFDAEYWHPTDTNEELERDKDDDSSDSVADNNVKV
eukprot:TRINITY_DN7689_c0_g1_i1.p1 TRINITY_DN7689_c0_g1~~TRINITY_DN7689_c0_g1_i1.p1  ORF type:complete len:638 (+),score=188.95 TRINITY_DN7689_c0_g1_i1:31-1944(+)